MAVQVLLLATAAVVHLGSVRAIARGSFCGSPEQYYCQ